MKITPEVKKRLRSMVKRNNTGGKDLWDVAEAGGANLERADVKNAGEYDMWASTSQEVVSKKPVPQDIVDIVTHAPVKVGRIYAERQLTSMKLTLPCEPFSLLQRYTSIKY